jgi:beta-galactosidase
MLLNGVWKFAPNDARTLPDAGWGDIRVPGSWMDEKSIVTRSDDWHGIDLAQQRSGWYQTEVSIPESWAGREVLLEFRRLSTDARVYVGDQLVGNVAFPEGELDLTSHLKPGASATINVFVVATTNQAETLILMGDAPGQNERIRAELWSAGIVGDVWLQARPAQARIDNVFIRPSVREKSLTLDIELAEVASPGQANIKATIVDNATQNVAQTFTGTIEATDGVASITWPWADAKLWDVGKPNLYRLILDVEGAGVDDQIEDRFGFREFWIEGKRFLLNGREFRARPDLMGGRFIPLTRGKIEEKLELGFNFGEFWPHELDQRGTDYEGWRGYAVADEMGLPISGLTPHMGWMGGNVDTAEELAAYTHAAGREMKRHRNHPSIVMWGTSGNMFGPIMEPAVIGQREVSSVARGKRSPHLIIPEQVAERGIAALRSFDPTRPIFIHHGGNSGDVYTMNHYLNMIPLQEREEWLSEYARKGDMPLMYVEFGTPVYATMLRGRNGYGNAQQTEAFMSEHVASYLGTQSYRLEPADYRATMVQLFKGGQSYEGWHWDKTMKFAPNWLELQALFLRNTWRSWRTWGMTGGMIPWDDGYARKDGQLTPAGKALRDNNQATLAWITGPAGAFTDKAHQFRPGQVVGKQVAILNDSIEPKTYELTVKVTLGDVLLHEQTERGTVEVAQDVFVPVEFTIPADVAQVTGGRIRLDTVIGDQSSYDNFDFTAFPATAHEPQTVAIVDPVGTTRAMLEAVGVQTAPWNGSSSERLLVIGREALSQALPGDLDAFVRAGGRVIVFAQQAEVLHAGFGLRTAGVQTRRVFAMPHGHAVTAGLEDTHLRDWAGTGTLQESHPDYVNDPRFNQMSPANFPLHGWRWGNRHTVSSVPIEKPHRSGWRPILECEFDLAYTPLMELHHGQGLAIWCQLDLEDQAQADPAAERLLKQLLAYARSTPVEAPRSVESNVPLVDSLGLVKQGGEQKLVVVDGTKPTDVASLEAMARAGANVLVLGASAVSGVKIEVDESFDGSLSVPVWPEARGLSASELRTRTTLSQSLVRNAPGFEIGADGLLARRVVGSGTIVICMLDPASLDADVKTYHRLTRWRQTRAIAQLLSNLGAELEMDATLLKPPASKDDPTIIDLAGPWQLKLTTPVPAAMTSDQRHPDPGVSDQARRLLAEPTSSFDDAVAADMPREMGLISDELRASDGEVVFRRSFDVGPELLGKELIVSLGTLDDVDEVWINGTKVGSTDERTPEWWGVPRLYAVPASLLKPSDNVIVVRIWDAFGGGGFTSIHARDLRISLPASKSTDRGFYHPDYIDDFEMGDDPYRYYNW